MPIPKMSQTYRNHPDFMFPLVMNAIMSCRRKIQMELQYWHLWLASQYKARYWEPILTLLYSLEATFSLLLFKQLQPQNKDKHQSLITLPAVRCDRLNQIKVFISQISNTGVGVRIEHCEKHPWRYLQCHQLNEVSLPLLLMKKMLSIYDGINQNAHRKEIQQSIYFNKAPLMTSDSLSKS